MQFGGRDMKWLIRTVGILAIVLSAGHGADAAAVEGKPGSLEVTYLGNEGFLIESAGKKVLIDALFKDTGWGFAAPSPELTGRITAGAGPFENIDLLLVTHRDADHFDAELVLTYLRQHPHVRLIAHKQVVDEIHGKPGFAEVEPRIEEIAAVPGDVRSLAVNKVVLDVLCLLHAYSPAHPPKSSNLGFIVKLGGARFVHLGDATIEQNVDTLQSYSFEDKPVSVLFLNRGDLSSISKIVIADRIKPARIVAMHIMPASFEAESKAVLALYPQAVIFAKSMDKATLP
jgi:L-ascorbate metabolism protein UlaG (beta-lactamase superfamily)